MVNEIAQGFISDKLEHSKEAIADANRLLKEQADPLADILSYTEKINLGWKKTYQVHGEISKQLAKTESELLMAQIKVQSTTGQEQKDAKNVLASIAQRKVELQKELNMLRVLNMSGFTPIFLILRETWILFKAMDKAAVEFNMTLGMMRSSTKNIQTYARQMAIDYMNVGVNIGIVLKSVEALGEVSGGIHNISQELVKTISILNSQLGISQETSAEFFRNMAAISGTSMESQQNMAGYAAALSNAAGTNLGKVMADLASKSANTLMLMSRIPSISIKSAVEFRKLGTSLDAVSDGAAHILNFTQSINEEMEASVLLGHSLNMQKARELSYRRDLVGYNKEILNMAQQNHFLDKMDYFQQQAFAAMTGKSVSDLTAMCQAEKELRDAKSSTNVEIRAAATEYERLRNLNQAAAKDAGATMLLSMQQKSNQERIVAIQQKWNQLIAQILPPILKLTDAALSIVPPFISLIPVLSVGAGFLLKWLTSVEKIVAYSEDGLTVLEEIITPFSRFTKFLEGFKIFAKLGEWLSPVTSIFEGLGEFVEIFGMFGKAIPGLGEIIMAVQGVWEGFKLIKEIIADIASGDWSRIGKGILKGIFFVPIVAYRVLIQPFVDLWHWFTKSPIAGHSPSKLGLSIVKGIVSVGAMIFDALTWPFRKGLGVIAKLLSHVPGMSKVSAGLLTVSHGVSPLLHGNNEIKPSDKTATSSDVTSNVKEQTTNVKEQINQNDEGNKLLQGVLDAINNLNKNLQEGKIAINLDGSLVSTQLARTLNFRGAFGTNS